MRWLLVAAVLVCCAAMVGQADDVPPEFRLFADAPVDVVNVMQERPQEMAPAFHLFSDSPTITTTAPGEIEVEIWVRDQCQYCDQWYQSIKADAAKRRGPTPTTAPRIKWIVRTDSPPAEAKALPYCRFQIAGTALEKSGAVTPDDVRKAYLKASGSFRN